MNTPQSSPAPQPFTSIDAPIGPENHPETWIKKIFPVFAAQQLLQVTLRHHAKMKNDQTWHLMEFPTEDKNGMSVQDIRINIWVGIYVLSNFHTISEPLLFVGPDQAFTHANTPSVRFQVNAKQINNLYRQYLTAVGRGN